MGEILTTKDIRWNRGWREALEEQQNYEHKRREREAETEKKQQQARKDREEAKQQAASNDWFAAVDGRIHEHLANWLWKAIDERIRWWFDHYFDGLCEGSDQRGIYADEIAKALAGLRREFECADEEMQRLFEARVAEQKERLASSEATFTHERDALIEMTSGMRAQVKQAFDEMSSGLGAEIAALEGRVKMTPGRLPVVKTWRQESVSYQAELVCHEGALWQACRDTAQAPGGSDWICVARAGRDGHDGLTPHVRGAYDAHKTYARLNIVEYDGAGYLARRDAPGVPGIPGDGWQLMSRSGRRGPVGETGPRGRKGERGARGEAASTITNWTIDRVQYRAVPTMSDGTFGAPLDLRPLFEAYHTEVSA
jgi:hypothetical protein